MTEPMTEDELAECMCVPMLRKRIADLQAEIALREMNIADASETVKDRDRRIAELEANASRLVSENVRLQTEIDSDMTLMSYRATNVELRKRVMVIEQDRDRWLWRAWGLEKALRNERQNLDESNRETMRLARIGDQAHDRAKEFEKRANANAKECDALKQQLAEATSAAAIWKSNCEVKDSAMKHAEALARKRLQRKSTRRRRR